MVALDQAMAMPRGTIDFAPSAIAAMPWWRRIARRYNKITAMPRGATMVSALPDSRDRLPVWRIVCRSEHEWIVAVAGGAVEYTFDDPASAEAFVRRQADDPLMLELCIGTLYIAARLGPERSALFVDTQKRRRRAA